MIIEEYDSFAPKSDLQMLQRLGKTLAGRTFLHVNSTKEGGGVAEILQRMIPILNELGINARWEAITGDPQFFDVTKKIHNALQGNKETITSDMWEYHLEVNKRNAVKLDLEADMVLIHDPQPLPLISFRKKGKWVWRCHIDLSEPWQEVETHIMGYGSQFDAAVFSVARFAMAMGIDNFIVPPSIDPLADKNMELSAEQIGKTMEKLAIPIDRPILLQVSRFDRFKDPKGVIDAYRLIKKYNDCILVLAGSPATDDPEGQVVLDDVRNYASDDPDIHILLLPPFSDLAINALQRAATIVLQKSLKEGFGLTVSEAMWKGKPVIGGAVGGIPLQIQHGVNGFLVHSSEGAAFRTRQLLNNPEMLREMGRKAREYVRNNFLITRQAKDYLAIWYILENGPWPVLDL